MLRRRPSPLFALPLLAACAPASESLSDSDLADPLPPEVRAALDAGEAPTVLAQVDDRWIEDEIQAARGPADRAGDRPELISLRALLWREESDTFLAELPAGVELDHRYENFPLVSLRLDDLPAAEALLTLPGLVRIEPDRRLELNLTESLGVISQATAEASGFTGAGTSVAVLDTGADYTHADLGSCTAVGTPASCRVAYATDFATSDGSRDDNGHGTNVSAIVAAVAPDTDILALDVFSGGSATSTDIAEALDWVIANQATYNIAAINMSLGSSAYTAPCSTSFATAFANLRSAGVAIAVASGNNAYTNAISWPACDANVLSVGAVYDSNMGAVGWSGCSDSSTAADKVTCFSNSASFLDILAPGALIVAGGYTMGGTSQATPHVAGALAVVRAANPTATVMEVEDKLLDNGDPITDTRNGYSFPRLDLASAVADCVDDVSPLSLSPVAAGESGTITVTASSGCAWTVSSDASWLTSSASSGTSSGTITYTAAANTGAARSGHLTISGRAITASQAADSAPTGTVSIAGGAAGTKTASVSLTLSASDSTGGVSQMCISNSTSCSSWLTYATSYTWTLGSGSGTKTVYVWFKDSYGNVSAANSDSIIVDTTKPTNGTVSVAGTGGGATVSWTGFTDSGAGISSYTLVQASGTTAPTASCTGTATWTGSETSKVLTGLTNGSTYTWRVCATDAAGNISTGSTASVTVAPEYVAPTGTISLNSGATYTNSKTVTATLSATDDSGVTYACLSNTSSCSTWFTMTTSKSWTLSGTGAKTVYAWFKDTYGNISTATTDAITVDTTKPTDGTVTTTGSNGALAVSWAAATDTYGIASYKLVYGTSSPSTSCASGTSAYEGSNTSATLSGLTNGTTYYVRVCATDNAGNVSTGGSGSGVPAPEYNKPTGTISLNSGATWTNNKSVTVTSSATDDTGVAQMCFSTSSTTCSSWVTYATTGTGTISATAGTRTLYGWFKDTYGTVSEATSDTIGYDATGPTNGTLTATATSGGASLSWTTFTDATSGLSSYKVVYGTSNPASTCSTGTVAYTGSGTSTTVSGLTTGSKVYFRVCGIDVAGNTGTGATGSVTVL